MNVWGVKKLGQSVLDISVVTTSEESPAQAILRAPVIGTGDCDIFDEESDVTKVNLYKTLGQFNLQQDLLFYLEEADHSIESKLSFVSSAVSNDLLPKSILGLDNGLPTVNRASIARGGLLSEWEF